MKLPVLYKRATTGKIVEWTIEVDGNKFRTTTGFTDGKKTTSAWTECEGKNVGKANGTTAEQQALAEATAIHRIRKIDQTIPDEVLDFMKDSAINALEMPTAVYDINSHGDFKRYYDTTVKRNYWVLGYFGGGSVSLVEAFSLAQLFAKKLNVPLETVRMDEILRSRRHKGFKFIYSRAENQEPEPECKKENRMENVYQWLTD